jgi:hypothetical protein
MNLRKTIWGVPDERLRTQWGELTYFEWCLEECARLNRQGGNCRVIWWLDKLVSIAINRPGGRPNHTICECGSPAVRQPNGWYSCARCRTLEKTIALTGGPQDGILERSKPVTPIYSWPIFNNQV